MNIGAADDFLEISVVIVSWNVANLLDKCIQSIVEYASELTYEIIVVDNHSLDHTVSMLRGKYPWVKLIENKENVGFARANNQGFEQAQGQYILILNPDTVLLENTIIDLLSALRENSQLGMVGPQLVFPNGEIQKPCARLLPTLSSFLFYNTLRGYKLPLIGEWFTKLFNNPYDYRVSQPVEAISGAAMLISRRALKDVKGFGEGFIHAGEDIDLCFRVRKAGWGIHYVSHAKVIHFGGKSSTQAPLQTAANTVISEQEYYRRCYGKFHGLFYRLIVQFFEVPTYVMVGFFKLLLGRETAEAFRLRIKKARAIWNWHEIS